MAHAQPAGAAPQYLPSSEHYVVLSSGQAMPRLGLGTWKAEKGVVRKAVLEAIKIGYRAIDCACDYGNEQEVGEGIKAAIKAGVCKREDLFITSKLWNTYHQREHVELACRKSLSDLGLDYLDLYLIHFPVSIKYVPIDVRYPPEWLYDPKAPDAKIEMADVPIRETWEGMEDLVRKGLAKNIGVSNFNCALMMDLLKYAKIRPAVNQIELHPYLVQENLVRFLNKVGVVITAYSPLGAGSYVGIKLAEKTENLMDEPVIIDLSKKYKRSPAQIVLRWHYQRGYTVIPKSSDAERLKENFSICEFQLEDEDMKKIYKLNRDRRYNDPAVFAPTMGEYFPIFD